MTLAEKLFLHMYTTELVPNYTDADMVEDKDGDYVKSSFGYYQYVPIYRGLETRYKVGKVSLEVRQAREALRIANIFNTIEKEYERE